MTFETDLLRRLLDDTAVAALVGTRVYWGLRPANTGLPCIVLNLVFGARAQAMAGPMGTQGNRVQFDCLAMSKSAAVQLRDAVFPLIETGAIVGTTKFQGGFVELYRPLTEDTPEGVVRTEQIDAKIWFN